MQNKFYAKLIRALTLPVFPSRLIPALLIVLALLPASVYMYANAAHADTVPLISRAALMAGIGVAIVLYLVRLLESHLLVPFERLRLANIELVQHDPLTGLPNRRLLQDRITQAMSASTRSGKMGALLLVDLDQFKNLNKTFGVEVGDLVLQQAALRMKFGLRACDTVARLAGDRFVIVLEDLSEQADEATKHGQAIGEKLLQSLNQPYRHMLYECACTASMGLTLFKGHKTLTDKLLKQSEAAMYRAKTAGRNTLRVFDAQRLSDTA